MTHALRSLILEAIQGKEGDKRAGNLRGSRVEGKVSSRKKQPAYGRAGVSFLVLTNLFLQMLFFYLCARDDTRKGKERKRKSLI